MLTTINRVKSKMPGRIDVPEYVSDYRNLKIYLTNLLNLIDSVSSVYSKVFFTVLRLLRVNKNNKGKFNSRYQIN